MKTQLKTILKLVKDILSVSELKNENESLSSESDFLNGLLSSQELLIKKLSKTFGSILNDWLGDSQKSDIINKGSHPDDFCDPNQAMIDATDTIFDEYVLDNPYIHYITERAWDLAQENDYYLKLETVQNLPDGFEVLESVGCVIDDNGVTYPMLGGGGYDEDGGCHIDDIENDEWILSDDDQDIVDRVLRESNRQIKLDASAIEHTICVLKDVMNGDESVHHMGSLSDFLLENADIIENIPHSPKNKPKHHWILRSSEWLIELLQDIDHREDYELKRHSLDYRVVDWIKGAEEVQNRWEEGRLTDED